MSSSISSSEDSPRPPSPTRFLAFVAVFLVMNLALVHTANYLIDPLQIFRRQSTIGPLFSEEQRYQVPGLIRHYAPAARNAIIGSSTTANIRSSLVNEVLGGETIKLSIEGSTASEHIMVANYLLDSVGDEIERVIWGFDTMSYRNRYGKLSQSAEIYPLHLYEDGVELIKYTLSIDTLIHSAQTLIARVFGISFFRKTSNIDDLNTWDLKDLEMGCGVALKVYHQALAQGWEHSETQELQEDQINSYLDDIEKILTRHPRTTFHFFFPPISILRMKLLDAHGQLELYGQIRNRLAKAMLDKPNFRLYDFQTAFEVTENLGYYRDTVHYDARISRYILEEIAAGHAVGSAAEVEAAFQVITRHVRAFDVAKADAACVRPDDAS